MWLGQRLSCFVLTDLTPTKHLGGMADLGAAPGTHLAHSGWHRLNADTLGHRFF